MHDSQQMQLARKQKFSPYRRAFVAFVSCAVLTACGLLFAQTGGTGAISGAITDPTGAMVVGAQVKATGAGTGYTQASQTNEHGMYLLSLLPPGQYTLEVAKPGFKAAVSPDVQVNVAETTIQNMPLETGAVTETITVASASVELQTESSELGRVTDSEMLESLPLVTRNFTQVIGLNAGVSQEVNNAGNVGRGGGSSDANPGGGSIMSQGATSTDNNFEMNGLTINDIQGSWIYSSGIPAPNPDAIQEFKVQTALFDATTGRNAGANVNVITKGGGNDFHASMFEFLRNEDLNANDWFSKRSGQPRGILRQNQYGFTAGGPLVKNKILLFGSYQGTKQYNETDPSNHKLDYLPPLTDDRSAAGLGAVFGGQIGYLGAWAGAVSPDGSNIAPQALALLQLKLPNGQYLVPTPQNINSSGVNPSTSGAIDMEGTAYISQPGFFNENQWMVNGDYLMSDRNKIAARYFGALSNMQWTTLYETEGFPLNQPERFDVASVGDTFTLSPTLVNQFLVGFHRSVSDQTYGNAFTFSSLGMNVPTQDNAYPNLYMISDGFETGTTSALAFLQAEYAITDALVWVKGKHQFTFGGGYSYGRDNMEKFDFEAYAMYLSWADFLLGKSNIYDTGWSNEYESYEGIGDFQRDWRYKDANGFIQDDYVVSKRLTLNLGFRWEHMGDLGSANGGGNVDVSALNPNPPATGSLAGYLVNSNYHGPALPTGVIQGRNTFGFNGNGQNTWNPRLGFAWSLPGSSDRFVLRGGIGVYHTTTEGQMNLLMCAEAPTGLWSVLAGQDNGTQGDANPFPAAPTFPVFTPYTPTTEFTLAALAMGWRPPTTYHYSLGLQSRLPGGAVLDVAYAGARDLHAVLGRSMNQAPLASAQNPIRGQTTNTVANINLRKPYLGYTANTMYYYNTDGEAWYSALQASLTQKFKHSFQYQAAYTWDRLLSPVPGFTTGSNEFEPTGDQTALRAHESGYGPDYNIRPQRFVLSAYYVLPSPAKSHAFLANTLGGWSVSTATVVQDGQQASISYNNTYNAYGITADRASYAPGCTAKDVSTHGSISHRVDNYINTSCFQAPAVLDPTVDPQAAGFGNTPNGILREPDQADVDLSLSKNQLVRWPKEGSNVQLRADFFNTLNHPNFAGPVNAASSATFGRIYSMSTNPRVVQLALRFSF